MNIKQARQGSKKKCILGISAILLLIVLLVPLGLFIYMSDSQALVVEPPQVDVNSAVNAKRIAKQFYQGLTHPVPGQQSNITLSEQEINGIIGLAGRGLKSINGQVIVSHAGVRGDLTVDVPGNPFGRYINVTTHIVPSPAGLVVDQLSVGRLNISGELLITLLESLLNRLLEGEALGTELLRSIESVAVNNSAVTLVYHRVPDFRRKIAMLKEQVAFSRDDSGLIEHYYQQLCSDHKTQDTESHTSLGYYLSNTFYNVQQRIAQNMGQPPGEENRAAMLALAIFLGSAHFNTLIGAIDEQTLKACQPVAKEIVLANRNDLRLHFIFSAALKIMSNSGVSFSIGEFKELLDSQPGSSGFSFADLAADRAGIRFAELAVDNEGALHIHKMAGKLLEEAVFFPTISGLPEGIDQATFEQLGGIDSQYYQQYLAAIEQRIDDLELYQSL